MGYRNRLLNLNCFALSLRNYLAADGIQHVGVNVDDMELSKQFYGDILGGIFIAEIKGITGEEWTTILNGTVPTAPQLGRGDALDVCFYSFGNTAVELLRYYCLETGKTHDAYPCTDANMQGVGGKHVSFNLAEDIDTGEFFTKLSEATEGMEYVSLNKDDLHHLGPDGDLGGWNCFFMSGPSGERVEFNQIPKGTCNADVNFSKAAEEFRKMSSES